MFLTNSNGGQVIAHGASADALLSAGWVEYVIEPVQEEETPVPAKAPVKKPVARKTAPKTN